MPLSTSTTVSVAAPPLWARAPGRASLALGVAVPAPGPEVCTRCFGPARHGPGECWCCRRVGSMLGERPGTGPPVSVAALCRPGDAFHAALRRYKDGPVAEARRHHAAVLGHLVDRFLGGTRTPAWWPAGVDAVVAVPSSTRRPVAGALPCPVEEVLAASRALSGMVRARLGQGAGRARHLQPAADAFVPAGSVAGQRLLVVDDTWVTGARARSAAASLARAGASVAAILVIGRAVDPDASADVAAWWARHRLDRA